MASFPALQMPSSLLSLLLLFLCRYHVSGDEQSFRVISASTLTPASVCSTSRAPLAGENTLKVSHRQGPCSPFGGGSSKPKHARTLQQDVLHVESLQRRLSREAPAQGEPLQSSAVTIPARRGTAFSTGNYVVTVGFGSPKTDHTVIFDTGSNVCWIQCQPCAGSCYPQLERKFDPAASSTYRNITCNTATCRNLDVSSCSGGTCLYGVRYGDSSTTVGFLAQETLTLAPGNVFPSFIFGCGQQNRGLFGKAAGLIGLGRRSFSLVSQTSQRLGDVFSYCLPATSSSTGHLTVGQSTAKASYTPMLTDSRDPSLYFIGLNAISVGGTQLPIPPSVFKSTGTLIDSGTVITRLPPAAYSALRSAFRSAMSQYPTAPSLSLLDTCYDFSETSTISYPVVTLHFDGSVDLPLKAAGIFYVADISQACLAFAGGDLSIVGNIQQRTVEVVHDIGAKRIGFATGACG